MKLKGKCKEEFERWYFKKYCTSNLKYKDLLPHHKEDVFGWFYGLNIFFQEGIYFDFFDWEEIYVSIFNDHETIGFQIQNVGQMHEVVWLEGKENVIRKAIETANEFYNESYKKA